MHKLLTGLLLSVGLLSALPASAGSEGVLTVTQKLLSEHLAVEAAQAAIDYCAARHGHAHVVIVDSNGVTRLLIVGDGSHADTVDGARRKAYTAAIMREATAVIAQQLAANPKMLVPPDSQLLFLAGGIPIRAGNEVIGAIGVGGGAPEEDARCAQAGLDKIQSQLH